MKTVIFYLLIMFSTANCANVENEKTKASFKTNINQQQVSKLSSGKYGDVSIAVIGDTVTGVYEYYDKWNESARLFANVNVFYFFGRLNNGHVSIEAGWPGDDLIRGFITYEDGMKLSLEDQPNGYAAVDFVSDGYKSILTLGKNWTRIGIIKSEKSYLYKTPSVNRTNIYVVNGDVVKIIESTPGWSRVEYSPPVDQNKTFTGWISNSDLYNSDLNRW